MLNPGVPKYHAKEPVTKGLLSYMDTFSEILRCPLKTGFTVHYETYLLTAESVRMAVIGDLMFFRSHTLTVRSSLPDTTLSPPANTAVVTGL